MGCHQDWHHTIQRTPGTRDGACETQDCSVCYSTSLGWGTRNSHKPLCFSYAPVSLHKLAFRDRSQPCNIGAA